jgi:hypothetical protein
MTELQSVSLKEAQMDNLAVPIQQSKVFLAQEAKQRVTDTPFTNKGTKTYLLARIINGKKKTMQLKFFVARLMNLRFEGLQACTIQLSYAYSTLLYYLPLVIDETCSTSFKLSNVPIFHMHFSCKETNLS